MFTPEHFYRILTGACDCCGETALQLMRGRVKKKSLAARVWSGEGY